MTRAGRVLGLAVEQSDAELIRGTRSGDLDIFGELLRRFQGRVHTLCARMTGDPVSAEQAAHGVFVSAYTDAIQLEAPVENWLLRCALDRCEDPGDAPPAPPAQDTLDAEPDTETEDDVKGQKLQAALDKLRPSFRAAVILRDVLDLEYAQIADIMGLPLGTAKSRVRRARQEMAAALTARAHSWHGEE